MKGIEQQLRQSQVNALDTTDVLYGRYSTRVISTQSDVENG